MSDQPLQFFIAGIMQGSMRDLTLHDQSYRTELCRRLQEYFPQCRIYDPFANHSNSVTYDDEKGRETFLRHNKMCGTEVDVLIAFAPEASMGTAIEMWEAYKNGAVVITISPLRLNWAIKFLSDVICEDLAEFFDLLQNGTLLKRLTNIKKLRNQLLD
ncbi:MAG: hypothetical protein FWC50_09580 [Planctomycetaceae bacterium]|nr:hypothetical protein [Planctomycetaceae bacterium]